MTELKPCPFCGGKAVLSHKTEWDEKCSYVYCTTCSIRTAGVPVSSEYSSDEKAVKVWNRREGECQDGQSYSPD